MKPDGPLLERTSELRTLQRAFDDAREGRGGVVLVEAHPGTGTTALGRSFAATAESEGAIVLAACATRSLRSCDLGPVFAGLASHFGSLSPANRDRLLRGHGELEAVLTGEVSSSSQPIARMTLLEAITAVTVALAESRPVVWWLDDAHLADAASIEFIAYAAQRLAKRPVLMLLGSHLTGSPAVTGLRQLTHAARRAVHLRLHPLSTAAAAALARQHDVSLDEEASAVIARRSAGLPALVVTLAETSAGGEKETARTPGHTTIRDVLNEWLDEVGASARAIFEAIAVGGAAVPHSVLARVAEAVDIDDPCTELREHGLIEAIASPTGTAYRVVVPVLAESACEAMGVGRWQRLHAAFANEWEAHPGASELDLAPHYRAAAALLPVERTIHVLSAAGAQHLAVGEYSEAIPNLETALALVEGSSATPRRIQLLADLGEAHYRAGHPREADAMSRQLLALVGADDPRGGFARLTRSFIRSDLHGEDAELPERLDTAPVSEAGQPAQAPEHALLQMFMSDRLADPDTTHATAEELRSLGVPGAPAREAAAAEIGEAVLASARREPRAARRHAERALALVADTEGGDDEFVGAAGRELMWSCVVMGDLDAAQRYGERTAAVLHRSGPLAAESSSWALLGALAVLRGDLAEARVLSDRGLALARRAGAPRAMIRALAIDGLIHATRSDTRAARASLAEAERVGGTKFDGNARLATILECAQVEVALHDARSRVVLPARSLFRVDGVVQLLHPFLTARLSLRAGDDRDAGTRAEMLRDLGRESPAADALADRIDGLRAIEGGRSDSAAALLSSAADRLEQSGLLLLARQARLEAAEVQIESGPVARERLLELVNYFDEQGMRGWSDRSRRAARAAKVRVGGRRAGRDVLTPREAEVAELVAEGHSNADVAHSLYLSERTVESHLHHIYERLGLASRTALVQHWAQRESAARDE